MQEQPGQNQKFELIWNMTRKCNYSCKYCYYPHDSSPVTESLPAQSISDLLDATGHEWTIQLTGGEPLLYPGIIDICETLTENHLIGIDTNLSITSRVRELAERVSPSRVQELYVSLHIEERERRGGLDPFIANVQMLHERGFHVMVNYVVHPTLQGRYHADTVMLAQHGIEVIPRPFKGEYNGRRYPEAYDGERVVSIFDSHPEQGKKTVFSFQGIPCSAGRTLLRLEPDGTVLRCTGDHTVLGNVLDTVDLPQGPHICRKTHCPCRCIDHVNLTGQQSDFVDGVQFAMVGDVKSSTELFRRASSDTLHPGAENNLGVLAWRKGDRAEAMARFRAAADQCPDCTTYTINLAGVKSGQPDFEPAFSLDVKPTVGR